jgi:tetratricopeptide (TPR) repeat protein
VEDARIRRWHRISELAIDGDVFRALRAAVSSVCAVPGDLGVREHLRALTDQAALHDQLVPLLSVEARAEHPPAVLAILRAEALHALEHVERPPARLAVLEEMARREPDNPERLEHLARTYYLVGAWVKAAQTLELLVPYVAADHGLVILRAAARLYRNSGRNDRALVAYRAVAVRKPSDLEALKALGELILAPDNVPGSPFDPPEPTVSPTPRQPRTPPRASPSQAPPGRAPRAKSRAGTPTQPRVSPVAATIAQSSEDAFDLFSSLDDEEVEASLAFAFGEPEPAEEPAAAKQSPRQTRERDGLLRPPARPATPLGSPVAAPDDRTVIDLDEIIDAPDPGADRELAERHRRR